MKEKPAYHFQKRPYQGFVAENNCCHLHLHRQAELSYVLEGEQSFIINGQTHLLKAGDLILTFPNEIHKLETSEYCKAITSIFDSNLVTDFTEPLNNMHFENCVFYKEELAPATIDALMELGKTGVSKSFKQHLIPYLEKGFLTVILTDLFSKRELIPWNMHDSSFIVTRFLNYVETHLKEDLSLTILTKELCISRSYLCSCIAFNTGKTPHELILDRRLDHARTLLRKTDIPIKDVALECGFSSTRTLFRNFNRAFQKTPLEYRQKKARTEFEKKE